MKLPLLLALAALTTATARADSLSDDAYSRIVAPGAHVVTLAQGLSLARGPVWNRRGFWVFSANGALLKITPTGKTERLREGSSNGHAYDNIWRLVSCEINPGRLTCKLPSGEFATLKTHLETPHLNAPQDVAIGVDGTVYFTDSADGAMSPGLYRLYPDEKLELLDKEWTAPTGIAFSFESRTLFVCDAGAGKIFSYDVDGNGNLAHKTLLATVTNPQGIEVDSEDRVLVAAAGGVWIYAPRGGLLGRIPLPGVLTGLAFGGIDGKSLLITAQDAVYSLRLREWNVAR